MSSCLYFYRSIAVYLSMYTSIRLLLSIYLSRCLNDYNISVYFSTYLWEMYISKYIYYLYDDEFNWVIKDFLMSQPSPSFTQPLSNPPTRLVFAVTLTQLGNALARFQLAPKFPNRAHPIFLSSNYAPWLRNVFI